jgi:hypothetical protein
MAQLWIIPCTIDSYCCNTFGVDDLIFGTIVGVNPIYTHPVYKLQLYSVHCITGSNKHPSRTHSSAPFPQYKRSFHSQRHRSLAKQSRTNSSVRKCDQSLPSACAPYHENFYNRNSLHLCLHHLGCGIDESKRSIWRYETSHLQDLWITAW